MYLTKFTIDNVLAIRSLAWEVPPERAPGWHVILGDNGSGKSSVLRAIAMALVGPDESMALLEDWEQWRYAGKAGSVRLTLTPDARLDKLPGARGSVPKEPLRVDVKLGETARGIRPEGFHWKEPQALDAGPRVDPESHVWGSGAGWFSASYGPFRRFTGGDAIYEKLFSTHPRLARHLSVFDESVALTEGLKWLQQLKFKQHEEEPEGALLGPLTAFINQPDFLPHQARLKDITSSEVRFVDGNGHQLPVDALSDGYRSILSMTFELIRQLAAAYGAKKVFHPKDPSRVDVPGVVLIDEVDAHLHPTWQQKVGPWFRKHFPKMQFIVTTHSPLVCQAADEGSIWRLPRPGTKEQAHEVTGTERDRLVFGNVLDAYGTGVFGQGVTRSERARKQVQRLAELNLKEIRKGLSAAERKEQTRLRERQPTTAMTVHELEDWGGA